MFKKKPNTGARYETFCKLDEHASNLGLQFIKMLAELMENENELPHMKVAAAKEICRQLSSPLNLFSLKKQEKWKRVLANEPRSEINELVS